MGYIIWQAVLENVGLIIDWSCNRGSYKRGFTVQCIHF